jgi:flavin reductase (DIM6/NTAB) family NADH-FMN oxidoreductase RutF
LAARLGSARRRYVVPMGMESVAESLNAGMIVLTTAYEGERSGCLVAFHTQCSITPVRYAVWLSKLNHTYRLAALSDHMAIHFLADGDLDLARLFGGTTGDRTDKFASVDWTAGPHGVPLLERCPARVLVRRASYVDDGSDHVCIVCEPLEVSPIGELVHFRPLRFVDVADIEPGHPAATDQRS